MIHNLPETPAFRDERPDSPISEIALRVLVEFEGGETHVIGTATLIAGHLAITAKHVLEHALREFGVQKKTTTSQEIRDYAVRLYQVMPGPVYRIWQVCMAWYCETDIAILHLGLSGTSEPDRNVEWRIPPIRATPPPVGQKIIAFGYRESVVKVSSLWMGSFVWSISRPSTRIVFRGAYCRSRAVSIWASVYWQTLLGRSHFTSNRVFRYTSALNHVSEQNSCRWCPAASPC